MPPAAARPGAQDAPRAGGDIAPGLCWAAKGWGFLEWLSPAGRYRTPLISAIMDGQARATHAQLQRLLSPRHYHRFDYALERGYGSPHMDDASKRNLRRLEQGALKMAEEMRPRFNALAAEIG